MHVPLGGMDDGHAPEVVEPVEPVVAPPPPSDGMTPPHAATVAPALAMRATKHLIAPFSRFDAEQTTIPSLSARRARFGRGRPRGGALRAEHGRGVGSYVCLLAFPVLLPLSSSSLREKRNQCTPFLERSFAPEVTCSFQVAGGMR